MRQKRFLIYLLLEVFIVLAVVILFKRNADVKIAAAEAGALFVLIPLGMIMSEYRVAGTKHRLWFFGVLQFWLFFALPILSMRLFNWEMNFQDIHFLGFDGLTMHYWSNKSYQLMVAITVLQAWKNYRLESQQKNKKPV